MPAAEKQKHIDDILENDGILIDEANVAKNPALRHLAKLFLNSAWRKFAQNPLKTEIKMFDVNDGDAVFEFFNSKLHQPVSLDTFGSKHIIASREPLKEGLIGAKYTNIVYGSITTATARMRLDVSKQSKQDRMIYVDGCTANRKFSIFFNKMK
ncbi:hypothetical protein GCK72_009176 [Caenorhabditis remanei]|uniref:DNA-directed DNA polymerase n=1 Tax=Caenorhabditis remanei TaxID=31234 RepID=A0A6A5H313_CAERE|nr:hypothetical protein GCK72_009176 [Caenorhabditis remanei]KAF1760923.1 hypothetical protein GCK72_009176 [Caenorhabditis remanei]